MMSCENTAFRLDEKLTCVHDQYLVIFECLGNYFRLKVKASVRLIYMQVQCSGNPLLHLSLPPPPSNMTPSSLFGQNIYSVYSTCTVGSHLILASSQHFSSQSKQGIIMDSFCTVPIQRIIHPSCKVLTCFGTHPLYYPTPPSLVPAIKYIQLLEGLIENLQYYKR